MTRVLLQENKKKAKEMSCEKIKNKTIITISTKKNMLIYNISHTTRTFQVFKEVTVQQSQIKTQTAQTP